MVSATDVANSILKRGFEDDIDITPMKLQKLIYLVYKKYYQDTGNVLFSERFEVWKYGPVIQSVYMMFKKYRSNAIRKYGKSSSGEVYAVDEKKSKAFRYAADYVWEKYKMFDGIRLSEMTHSKGTAWWKAAVADKQFLSDEDIRTEEEYI